MRKPHLILPPPTGGMNLAKRPTGITMALVVLLIAMTMKAIPDLIADPASLSPAIPALDRPSAFTDRELKLVAVFSFALSLGVLWIWVRAKERRRFSTLGLERDGQTLPRILRGAAAGLGLVTVCILVPVITGQATLTWNASSIGTDGLLFVGLMLIGFLVQGSTEEILVRGFITQAVARRWGLIAAVIVQAVIFAAMHGGNPGMGAVPVVNLALFAVFAIAWTLTEGSLWGICAWHGVWNWAQGNFFGVRVSGSEVEDSIFAFTPNAGSNDLITGGAFGIEGSLVTSAVLLIAILILWRKFRASRGSTTESAATATSSSPAASA